MKKGILALFASGVFVLFLFVWVRRDACAGPSFGTDVAGNVRSWQKSRIVLHIALPRRWSETRKTAARSVLERAVGRWSGSDAPRIELRSRAWPAVLNEDGENTISFQQPRRDCSPGTRGGMLCLPDGLRGATKLYSVEEEKGRARIVEADVVLKSALTEDLASLEAVVVHELGHVLGLDHPDPAIEQVCSAMRSDSLNTKKPRPRDLRALEELYSVKPASSKRTVTLE